MNSSKIVAAPVERGHRIAGSLIGQCLGDALGFVVEGRSRETCLEYVEYHLMTDHAGRLGRAPFGFGQYTDDSQLARELSESLVARGGFVPADYGERISAIFTERRIVGRGKSTAEAAERLARGVPWHEAGTLPPAAGNGGAMRTAPIGWIYDPGDPALVRDACDQARITHQDPRSQAGAAVIAKAVALALQPCPVSAERMIDELTAAATVTSHDMAAAVSSLHECVALPLEEAFPRIAGLGKTPEEVDADPWKGTISPFVTPSVVWALYAYLRTPDDYWATICSAISGGGDTDTTAAMTGAISGARLGLSALPEKLARRVNDRALWCYDDLILLAEQVARLGR